MGVGNWTFFNKFRKNLGVANINFSTGIVRLALFQSTSNLAGTISSYGSLTNEVATNYGYTQLGKSCSTYSWSAIVSAGSYRFNINAGGKSWKASGGNIANIKFAVLYLSGASSHAKRLICYSQLSTAQFTLNSGNTLTISPSATGVFNLT